MKKRILSILLCCVMLVGLLPTAALRKAVRKNRLFAAVKQPARRTT